METVRLTYEVEYSSPTTDIRTDSENMLGSEDETTPTQRTMTQESIRDDKRAEVKAEISRATNRAVDVINLPPPKRRGNPRVMVKQLRQTILYPKPNRLAVHQCPSGLTVQLDILLVWAWNTANMEFVMAILQKYPVQLEDAYLGSRNITCLWEAARRTDHSHSFVIPVHITCSLQGAVATAKRDQNQPEKADVVKKHGVVLDVVATTRSSGSSAGALAGFHAIKAKRRMKFEDRKWLEQLWTKIPSNVSLFDRATRAQGLLADAVCYRLKILVNEGIGKFTSRRLLTEFITLSGNGTITFENILGGLCRDWLNDSHVDFCLRTLDCVGELLRHTISAVDSWMAFAAEDATCAHQICSARGEPGLEPLGGHNGRYRKKGAIQKAKKREVFVVP